jgi:cobalamin-dependent methionine synthase I
MLASEMVEMVESKKIDLVCVSALPPAAVAHSRYLCKRLHSRFSDIPVIVGLWKLPTDLAKAKARIACSNDVRLITTLHDAIDQIGQMSHSIIIQSTSRSSVPSPALAVAH